LLGSSVFPQLHRMAYVWKYECAKRPAMCERGDAQMESVIGTIEKEVDRQG